MPQSFSAVNVHLVFSTKLRQTFFGDVGTRTEVHKYLGGISKKLDCPPVIVGGVEDHIHLLGRMGRTVSLADWVKELKRVSNLWMKERGSEFANFEWQSGYAAFSVSQSNIEVVNDYIANQEEHHRQRSFQDELRTLLQKHELEFDERYVWD